MHVKQLLAPHGSRIVGTIAGVINKYEYDTDYGADPSIVEVASNVFAIAYGGSDNDGYIKTIAITDEGTIGAIIDTIEFDPALCANVCLAHVTGDIYVVAYQGPDNDGWLATVDIDAAGNIGAVQGTFEIDGDYGRYFSIIHISGNVFAFVYQGSAVNPNRGTITTLPIDGTGAIGAVIATEVFENNMGAFPDIIHISGNVYAIAHTGRDEDGWVRTWNIATDGTLGGQISEFEFDNTYCHTPRIIHVSGDIYAIAYQGPPSPPPIQGDGFIKTISINATGTTIALEDTLEFDITFCSQPSHIVYISGDVYAIAYEGDGDDGILITIHIANDGTIVGVADSLIFEAVNCWAPELIKVTNGVVAICHAGVDDDGWLVTARVNI